MNGALIAPPSANLAPSATLAWTVGTADASYPITNLQTLEPDIVAKTTGTTATLRATFGGATALQGVALINTNLGGLTIHVANNGGLGATPCAVPDPDDGLCVNAYWDLRGVSGTTASQWTIAIVGAPANIAIGTLLLITSWTLLRVRWEWEIGDVFPVIEHRTSYGKRLQYQIPVRTRKYRALAFDAAQRNLLRALAREAHGSIMPWTLVPDMTDDAVLLVQFTEPHHPETHRFGYGTFPDSTATGIVDRQIEVEEVSAGVAL